MERFPGYTLTSLMQEDTELLRLVAIEELGGGRDNGGEEVGDV